MGSRVQTILGHDLGGSIVRRHLVIAPTLERHQLYPACKRIFDIVVSALVLVIASPFMLLIALLIMCDSRGPAVYTQERVRLVRRRNGSSKSSEVGTFTMYKYRTMVQGASSATHRAFVEAYIRNDEETMASLQGSDTKVRKLVNDPRITRIGKLLRRTSLDELPQLWNVLRGDMSLVGPRPPIPYEVEMYEPWHFQRLSSTPGLTGLWQVRARSSATFDEMVKLDMDYLEHCCLWLDIKILFQTPLVALGGKGSV